MPLTAACLVDTRAYDHGSAYPPCRSLPEHARISRSKLRKRHTNPAHFRPRTLEPLMLFSCLLKSVRSILQNSPLVIGSL